MTGGEEGENREGRREGKNRTNTGPGWTEGVKASRGSGAEACWKGERGLRAGQGGTASIRVEVEKSSSRTKRQVIL